MEQDTELSEYTTIHELQGTKTHQRSGATPGKRSLLTVGIAALAALCILQAALNVSLRLAFSSKEDADPFPFDGFTLADVCRSDRARQNSTQWCSSCEDLLGRLLRQYQALERERDVLCDIVVQLGPGGEYTLDLGSGTPE